MAAAAALALASPLRRLLRAPHPRGAISAPYYGITRGKPERPSYLVVGFLPLR